jgi:DNA polymerase III epsilon subunit-like protein
MDSSIIIYNQFDNDNFNGKVTLITDSYIYVGEIKSSKFDGTGRQQFNTGNIYEGQFKNGKYHGKGIKTVRNKNGSVFTYEGDFVDGLEHGKIVLHNEKNEITEICQYINGVSEGYFIRTSDKDPTCILKGTKKNGLLDGEIVLEEQGSITIFEYEKGVLYQEKGRCYYLVIDTETTGLYTKFGEEPRLVQLGYRGYDKNKKLITEGNLIIKPNGFEIPKSAFDIHGISTKDALLNGMELKDVLVQLQNILNKTDLLIGHNIAYDIKILYDEFERENLITNIFEIETYCTDKYGREYLEKYKEYGEVSYTDDDISHFISLSFLYKKLLKKEIENSHDAYQDAKATFECYEAIIDGYNMMREMDDDAAIDYWANYRD